MMTQEQLQNALSDALDALDEDGKASHGIALKALHGLPEDQQREIAKASIAAVVAQWAYHRGYMDASAKVIIENT